MSSVSWQNALTICLILAILLTLFVLSTPAFADSTLLALPLLSDNQRTTLLSEGLFLGNNGNFYYYAGTLQNTVYVGKVGASVAFVSVDSDAVICSALFQNGTAGTPLAETPLSLSPDGSYYSYAITYAGLNFVSEIPSYDSVESFASVVLNQAPPSSSPLEYSLPAGNIAYIKLPERLSAPVTYSLATTFPVLDLSSYSLNNQVSTVVSSIPSGQASAPSSPTIPWSSSGKVNLFGLSRNQSYDSTIPTSYAGQYLLICNPLYYPVVPTGGGTGVVPPENGSIDIVISSADSISVFPLDSRLQFTGSGLAVDATTSGDSFTGTVDPDTGSLVWVDPDGGDSAPVVGGNTQVDSINDSIYDYLRNIVQGISEFLRGPVDAVRTVVDALRSFMSSFVQLYQWLPSPVYNLITAGLMIAVTIGVIKIFV